MRRVQRPQHLGVVEAPAEDGGLVYVASLPDGPIVVLRDTALTIWREATAPSSNRELVERVADVYGGAVSEIREAVHACVADLVGRGVLEVVDPE